MSFSPSNSSSTNKSYKSPSKSDRYRDFWTTLSLLRLGIPFGVRSNILSRVKTSRVQKIKNGPLLGKSTYSKQRYTKNLGNCYKCGRHNRNSNQEDCYNRGIISTNRQNKVEWTKHRLRTINVDTPIYIPYEPRMLLYIETQISRFGIEPPDSLGI